MRAVIQKVKEASVEIRGNTHAGIKQGLLVFLGVEDADTDEDISWLAGKISRLRVFDDAGGVMNLSVMDVKGEIMVISQFTLHASTKKGNRPSYIRHPGQNMPFLCTKNSLKHLPRKVSAR